MKNKTKLPAAERAVLIVNPIPYVRIPSEDGEYNVALKLIPLMTQEQASRYSQDGFSAVSMPTYFKVFSALYELRNTDDAETARQFIENAFRKESPLTLTRILYTPKGKDKIIHDYNTDLQRVKRANLTGKNGLIKDFLPLEASLALTGKEPKEVEELMQYLNGTSVYVWRLISKQNITDERDARFFADSDLAGLDCSKCPSYKGSWLGVRFIAREKNFMGKQ